MRQSATSAARAGIPLCAGCGVEEMVRQTIAAQQLISKIFWPLSTRWARKNSFFGDRHQLRHKQNYFVSACQEASGEND